MNPNVTELINIAIGVASYAFVILFVFNILKVDTSIQSSKDLLLFISLYPKFLFLVTSFI